MRFFFIILLISTIWSCEQAAKDENQNSKEENETSEEEIRYFYWSVDWHPSKEQIVLGGMQDTLRLFSTNDFQLLKNYPYKGTITKTKWHPTENKLAISVQDGLSYSTILNVDTDESKELDSISIEGARAIGWNSSGDLLAVGDSEGYLMIFDKKGNFLKKIDTGQKAIIGLDWHPTKSLIVAIGEKIALYDYKKDDLQTIKSRAEEMLMLCVAWHPDGVFFVTGDYGDFERDYPPLLQYWTQDGQEIKSIEESKAEFRNMKWSSDGELLATVSEKIRLWDKEGNLVAEKKTENLLWGIDWNEDDSQLVVTDRSGNIIFFDKNLNQSTKLP